MARLKTLKDSDETAAQDAVAGDVAPETAPEGEAAAGEDGAPGEEAATEAVSVEGVSTSLDTNGEIAPDTNREAAPLPAPVNDPVALLTGEVEAAKSALDAAQAEYLAQSDKLAAANSQVASLTDDLKDREARIDALTATLAQRDAQIAALGAAPPAPVAEATIKRPKVGTALELPEEDDYAKWGDVAGLLDEGELVVLVLADDNGVVQPYPAVIGGKALFTAQAGSLLYGGMIQLEPEMDQVTLRFAVLLDAGGKVLSVCRLGALLIGGGGLSAMIPGNNLRFNFG